MQLSKAARAQRDDWWEHKSEIRSTLLQIK
jgi:hypothetical protein